MRSLVHFNFCRPARCAQRLLPLLAAWALSAAAAPGAAPMALAVVQVKSVNTGFELDGVIQAVKQSTVSAQASGRIASLLVKAGDKVHAGQLLATIDDRETQTGVQRSQAQLAQASAELRNAQASFDRTRDLQAKGFLSAAALDNADAQLKAAQAGRAQASAGERQSILAQGFTRVTAPFDAWVLQTQVQAGDLALPGKPLLTLYAPAPVRAVVQVPVSRAGQARSASSVEVLLSEVDAAARWIRPSATSVVPSADAVSQTVEWRLELSVDAAKLLLPGQQVRVRFVAGQASHMLVPTSAVLHRGELTAVYVASGQGFALKAVRLGASHGSDGVEVLAGLASGERVALDPVRAGLSAAPVGQTTGNPR